MDSIPSEFEEKRQSLRVDMEAERVVLNWRDAEDNAKRDFGVCIDLARRGLLIEYHQPFALGMLIEVTFNPNTDKQSTVKGQVCRCSECHSNGFHIAMQLI